MNYHKAKSVIARENFVIEVVFVGGEVKQYDMKQLFNCFPQFQVFKEETQLFESAYVEDGGDGIVWNDDLDLSVETVWEDGILIEAQRETDINRLLAYHLLLAREKTNMTQKQLAERTGIYQADISKIERGLSNPSLSTLKRLADGMNMELRIEFVEK